MELHYAAARGDRETAEAELAKGVDVNAPNDDRGQTPLALAAGSRRAGVDMLELLIANGARINGGGNSDCIPLSAAADAGDLAKVRYLLEQGADVSKKDASGHTAITSAVRTHSPQKTAIIELLIENGAELNFTTKSSKSPLSVPSMVGDFALIRFLLDKGADPSSLAWDELKTAIALGDETALATALSGSPDLSKRDSWERTPFLLAAMTGDVDKAELLLAAGARKDDKARCGKTALMLATTGDHADMARWLLGKGAPVDETDQFEDTALIWAARHRAHRCVKVLLEAGAEQGHENRTKSSAVTEAVDIETVDILVAAGADIDRISGEGYSLLMYAAESGDDDFAKALLARGADTEATSTGETAVHKAVMFDSLGVLKLLLDAGASPNALDVDGYSPLCFVKTRKCLEMLLDAGASPTLKDDVGDPPATHLLRHGDNELGRLLFAAMEEAKGKPSASPLHAAACLRDLPLMRKFAASGVEVDVRDQDGKTPLHWAVADDPNQTALAPLILEAWAEHSGEMIERSDPAPREKAVDLLLDRGASLEARDDKEETPLLSAIGWGREEAARKLIARSADVNAESLYGRTPLWLAACGGRNALLELLLENGASIAGRAGAAALHIACHHGHADTARLIITKGVDANAEHRSNDQTRALHAAAFMGHLDVVRLLLEHGAEPLARDIKGDTALDIARKQLASYSGIIHQVGKERRYAEIIELLEGPSSACDLRHS